MGIYVAAIYNQLATWKPTRPLRTKSIRSVPIVAEGDIPSNCRITGHANQEKELTPCVWHIF